MLLYVTNAQELGYGPYDLVEYGPSTVPLAELSNHTIKVMPITSGEYPATGMTADTSVIGGMTWIASASSFFSGRNPYMVFNKQGTIQGLNSVWTNSSEGVYDTTTGQYSANTYATTVGTSTIGGEWVQIQFPIPIALTSYSVRPSTGMAASDLPRNPSAWVILGSEDGSTWTSLDSQTGVFDWNFTNSGVEKSYSGLTNATKFSYFRFIVNAIQPNSTTGGGMCEFAELRLYGLA